MVQIKGHLASQKIQDPVKTIHFTVLTAGLLRFGRAVEACHHGCWESSRLISSS